MKVKELLNILSDISEDLDIIIQKDAEGNGYSPLEEIDEKAYYIPDSTWSGDIYPCKEGGENCIVLMPVN